MILTKRFNISFSCFRRYEKRCNYYLVNDSHILLNVGEFDLLYKEYFSDGLFHRYE